MTVQDGYLMCDAHRREAKRQAYGSGTERAGRPPKPCGTEAAYQRHSRARQTPCDDCRDAHKQHLVTQYENSKRKASS